MSAKLSPSSNDIGVVEFFLLVLNCNAFAIVECKKQQQVLLVASNFG